MHGGRILMRRVMMPKFEFMWRETVYYRAVVEAENVIDAEYLLWGSDSEPDRKVLDVVVDDGSVRSKRIVESVETLA